MIKHNEIIPGESIGPFKLGMTRDEIERLSIRPMKTGGHFPQPGIYVYYDAAGRCNKIEAIFGYKPSPPTFTLLGHIVNGMTDKEMAGILASIATDVRFSYASVYSLSAGLRATKWEASDDHIMSIRVMPRKEAA
jgi:hypothetical protein